MPGNCGSCGKEMTAYVTVKEVKYHADCFKCKVCSGGLAGKPFFEKDGTFYCENDYLQTFGSVCAHCDQLIKGQYIEALDKTWCANHFVCSGCGNEFKGDLFRRHEERPWCDDCFLAQVADSCGKCHKPVTGQCFEAVGNKFHADCFVCSHGDHKISDGETFYESEKKLFCKDHFTQAMAVKCAECKKNITGEYYLLDGNKVHKDCWACCHCKKALEQGNVGSTDHGKYMCKACTLAGKSISAAGGGAATAARRATVDGPSSERSSWSGTSIPLTQPKQVAMAALEAEKKDAIDHEDFIKANEIKMKLLKLTDDEGLPTGTSGSDQKHQGPVVCYPISFLQTSKAQCPVAFDYANREQYLANDDFFKVFQMSKEAFSKLPAWRRKMKKQDAGLF